MKNRAYINSIDRVCDILEYGLPLDKKYNQKISARKVAKISQLIRAQEIYHNVIRIFPNNSSLFVIWMNEWSDDFDQLNSIKSNRKYIWSKTLTIAPLHKLKH